MEELRFSDFFVRPVGPKGLETTERLRSLDGKKVRIVGYMVHEEIDHDEEPAGGDQSPAATGVVPDRLMLCSSPQTVNFGHYGLCDDLPPAALFVHLAKTTGRPAPFMRGPLLLTGILSVGARSEPEGRNSLARLQLDTISALPAAQPQQPSPPDQEKTNQPQPIDYHETTHP